MSMYYIWDISNSYVKLPVPEGTACSPARDLHWLAMDVLRSTPFGGLVEESAGLRHPLFVRWQFFVLDKNDEKTQRSDATIPWVQTTCFHWSC